MALAINELLVSNGYPPEATNNWWVRTVHTDLGGRTPAAAWAAGDYATVGRVVRDGYASSEKGILRTVQDPEELGQLRRTLAILGRT